MIGELDTIFYLCFLVLLVYFLVFAFVLYIKNPKNNMSSSLLATQCLTSLKPDLIGMKDSLRINKSGTKNTACLKRGYTYGNKYISCMSMLETCAQNTIYLSAGMKLVAL